MSFPLTIKSLPMWYMKDDGFVKASINSLNCLARWTASDADALHASRASGNPYKPSPKA